MCTSSSDSFAWVGFILVNLGFISLISWGTAKLWPIGFVLSSLYSVFLFWLARALEKRESTNSGEDVSNSLYNIEAQQEGTAAVMLPLEEHEQLDNSEVVQQQETTAASIISTPLMINKNKPAIRISLLYGLAVFSVGVTGFFLPINLFPECENGRDWSPRSTWTTNVTALPQGARNWANRKMTFRDSRSSFGFIETTKITLFRGAASLSEDDSSSRDDEECLFRVKPSTAPVNFKEYSFPDKFTTLSNETVCFISFLQYPKRGEQKRDFVCSDGEIFQRATDPSGRFHTDAFDMLPLDGTLWFKEHPYASRESGVCIFSLDPGSMTISLHSERVNATRDGTDNSGCSNVVRKQAIGALFATALPVTLISILIWNLKQIPSMGMTIYVGFTLIFVTLYIAIDSDFGAQEMVYRWWFSITGMLWILLMSHLLLSDSTATRKKASYQWGLLIGALAFLSGMVWLLLSENDTFWSWVLLNLLCFIPLILLGAATNTTFLMFSGALGFLLDSWRLAEFVGDNISGDASAPMQFLVFSLTGLVVGAMGYQLSKYQQHCESFALAFVQKVNACLSREVLPSSLEGDMNPLFLQSQEMPGAGDLS